MSVLPQTLVISEPGVAAVSASPDEHFEQLRSLLDQYIDADKVLKIETAYQFSCAAHQGQKRLSGEDYIHHPLDVAIILAQTKMDADSIMAALLHDVIEDTAIAKEEIALNFGTSVASLVDGVSKLTHIKFEGYEVAQAENFRKMLLAMINDIRVIIIKLADRLHNMRTISAVPQHKRTRISRETLEIYAPIAHRLSMSSLRMELQDLGFYALYPMRYRVLKQEVMKARGNRKEIINKIKVAIEKRMAEEGFKGTVDAREKHVFSIYEKMKEKHLSFKEVFDVYGFRIVVDSIDDCYRALGVIHGLYKPLPGKFKDYIAIPKLNGYQSLHTILFGPYGVAIEGQIRTADMNDLAEVGVAAHWAYKSRLEIEEGFQHQYAREWVSDLLELQEGAGDSLEFLENVKIDLFPDEVYVFTPDGEIMVLPRDATIIDFAYKVHSQVGNTCVAAKVDRRYVLLSSTMMSGQTVEIITQKGATPNPTWFNFVKTAKARNNIRTFMKSLQATEAIKLGWRLLNHELAKKRINFNELPDSVVEKLLLELRFDTFDLLLTDIGIGHRASMMVASRIITIMAESTDQVKAPQRMKKILSRYVPEWMGGAKAIPNALAIEGTEGMVVGYAQCCRPIPGDTIIGVMASGRGIMVHENRCKKIKQHRQAQENMLDVHWSSEIVGDFKVDVQVESTSEKGVLATVAAAFSALEANIDKVGIGEHGGQHNSMQFTIEVRDRKHLADIMRRVHAIKSVKRIKRVSN